MRDTPTPQFTRPMSVPAPGPTCCVAAQGVREEALGTNCGKFCNKPGEEAVPRNGLPSMVWYRLVAWFPTYRAVNAVVLVSSRSIPKLHSWTFCGPKLLDTVVSFWVRGSNVLGVITLAKAV